MADVPTVGLFLHASAVVVEGGAVLFLGHSTAGKSTIARLLGASLPVLADDAVFAARDADGGWRVVEGGFRFEDGDVFRRMDEIQRQVRQGAGIPLRGCFRLRKADDVKIEPLIPSDLARVLIDAVIEIDVQRKVDKYVKDQGIDLISVRKKWFRWVAEIARKYPGWMLYFTVTYDPCRLCELIKSELNKIF